MPKQTKRKGITWANSKGLPLNMVGNTLSKQNYNRTPSVNMAALRLRRAGLPQYIEDYPQRQTRKNWENQQEAMRYEASLRDAMNRYPQVSDENLDAWYKSFGNASPFPGENGTPRMGATVPTRNELDYDEELGLSRYGGKRSRKRRGTRRKTRSHTRSQKRRRA
jgi:hypothetical protein